MSKSEGFLERGDFTLSWFEDVKPINVSVIGPVSHGKTSVLRTLQADGSIGSVGAGPTTMHPEPKMHFLGCEKYLIFRDTPGWELSGTVLVEVEKQHHDNFGITEICSVVEKLGSPARKDKRAWDQVKNSDVILVIFNGKQDPYFYQDDIKLLSRCGTPKIAIVNFTENDDCEAVEGWRKALRNRGIDTVKEYDAHERDFNNEIELLEQIATKLEPGKQRQILDKIVENRKAIEKTRLNEATRLIVNYLIEIVLLRKPVISTLVNRETAEDGLREWLRETVVFSEIATHEQLVKKWGFGAKIIEDRSGVRHCDKPGEIKPSEHQFFNRIRRTLLGNCKVTVRGTSAIGIASLTRLVDTVRQLRRRGKALETKTMTIEEKPASLSKDDELWSELLDQVGDRKKGKEARSQLTKWVDEQIRED